MADKKLLNDDELDKVAGGSLFGWHEGDPKLDIPLTYEQTKGRIGEYLFFDKGETWCYGQLKSRTMNTGYGQTKKYQVYVTKTNNRYDNCLNWDHYLDPDLYTCYLKGTFPNPS